MNAAIAATALAGVLGTGCTQFCHDIGYQSGAELVIDTATPDTYYWFEVEAGREAVQLSFWVDAERKVTCDAAPCRVRGNSIELGEPAWGLVGDAPGRIHMMLTGFEFPSQEPTYPEDLIIRAARDGLPVYASNHTVPYETTEPNGEGCGEQVFGKIALVVP